jgi:hypothetical protein
MSKLYDLMIMSFKYQLLRMKFPEEIYQITMNHLNELVKILERVDPVYNKDVLEIVRENIKYVEKVFNYKNRIMVLLHLMIILY